ncbi:MAG TPA: D-lyxose/D-mannose family sugar isomerase [Geminicoccus sp.]|uniref:D-lyxose/D-mannose family sugar isomerase n=1 Tax=Geminicoccus sp. TaxID=2024832 RepID=UPI002E326DE3|nr:D-lyxose/D-mannose family sugar isomerase [Geminicoccus sp.]HEX2528107.1 D-lyxose/D-mannose family sugar isomerase [Geminicoccus sp.]
MKRSEINQIMRAADAFFRSQNFHLPPFAYWSPDEWRKKGPEADEIVQHRLGWDITDFGRGRFCKCGLVIFTIRNGAVADLQAGRGKLYCEKILMLQHDQVCPMHFHWQKMEDIINRGGGDLHVQVYHSTPAEDVDDRPVTLRVDGVLRTVDAGTAIRLQPGESITILPGCYHKLWGWRHDVLMGEVSLVNDDDRDNRFLASVGRFATIEEDERPLFLLRDDYERFWGKD